MNRTSKLILTSIILVMSVLIIYYFIIPFINYEEPFNGFSGDNSTNTIIILSSTGDMKGLEVGVAAYAGENGIPLILASNTLSYPINEWLPLFLKKLNIKKVIWIGPISKWQFYSLKLLNLKFEQVNGLSKAQILTELAEKNFKSVDTVIITTSDPSASLLGAVIHAPVFIVAAPAEYSSLNEMPLEYDNFISQYHVKNAIIVGPVSSNIIEDLKSKNLTVEDINGNDSYQTSTMVSDQIIAIQKNRGVKVNSAYCGFYGELPSIIPLAVKNHSIIIQDPTIHMDETITYLKDNNISNAIITRNGPADYLQMEEPDFVSSKLTSKLISNGIITSSLTNFRTPDEATGLYETDINAAELLFNSSEIKNSRIPLDINIGYNQISNSEYPPILNMILTGGNWNSNTGSELTIKKIGLNQWYYDWKGVHPYIWTENGENWFCNSDSNYSWNWSYNVVNTTWTVNYLSCGKIYYTVYWAKNGDTWEEIHPEGSFDWKLLENSWICTKNGTSESYVLYLQPVSLNFY
jgi:putative cell wall-binding protein